MRKVITKAVSTILITTMVLMTGCSKDEDPAPQVAVAAEKYTKALLRLDTSELRNYTQQGYDIFGGADPADRYKTPQRFLLGNTVLINSEQFFGQPVRESDGSYKTNVTVYFPDYKNSEDYEEAVRDIKTTSSRDNTDMELNLVLEDGKWVVGKSCAEDNLKLIDKVFDDAGIFLKDSRFKKAGKIIDQMMSSLAEGKVEKLYEITGYDPWEDTDLFNAQQELYFASHAVEDMHGEPHEAQKKFIKEFFANTTYTYEIEYGDEAVIYLYAKVPDSGQIADKVLATRDMNVAGIASIIAMCIDMQYSNTMSGYATKISNDYTYEMIYKNATEVVGTVDKKDVDLVLRILPDSGRLMPDKDKGRFMETIKTNLTYDVIYSSDDTFDSELKDAIEIFVTRGLIDRAAADRIYSDYVDEARLWAYGQSVQDKGNN